MISSRPELGEMAGGGVERYTWMLSVAKNISQSTVPELFRALKIQFNGSTQTAAE